MNMVQHFEDLDQAVEFVLEKATANNRAHITAATMTQEDHDKHADALAHHAAAIMHYRNKPEVKKALEQIGGIVPHRSYINKPLKLDQKEAPQISAEDLNHDHPALKGRDDANKQQLVTAMNKHLEAAHKQFHSHPDLKALNSHSKRFLAHMSAMLEWHNLQKKGEGAHHQFAGQVNGPELEDNHSDSRFRGHSTPSATDRTKFRTQSITKGGGAKWHPGFPELTSLEEAAGHPSAGKMKELYPFHEIKVNNEPLAAKSFDEKGPEEIHEQDYATNLTKEHKVKHPDGTITQAMGGYHGSKSANQNMEGMSRVGMFKKSERSEISSYFPEATLTHLVLAKNLIEVLNPYAAMTDEEFGEYMAVAIGKRLGPSEQAALLVESENRLEKAAKKPAGSQYRISDSEHRKGIEDVLAGHVTPLPMTDASERTTKEGEKRNEVQDIEQMTGQAMKRSPYAVPKELFTDDTYSKVDPEKYKEWVAGKPSEQDHRNMMATYQQVVRHNPEAQKRHKAFIDLHREQVKSGLGRSVQGDDIAKPVNDHKATLAQAGADLRSGKITPQEFAEINSKAAQQRKENVGHKASAAEMTPEEKKIKEVDPSYAPKRQSAAGKAEEGSMKDLTSIARGQIPSHMLADKGDLGHGDDSEAQAKDMVGGKGADGEGTISGSVTQAPSPIQLINDHPGFKAYLKMKEHLLDHYKNPAVRKYMEEKLNAHENNPNLDVGKLAATFHFLHRSKNQAMKAGKGQEKLMGDIMKPSEGGAAVADETNEPAGAGSAYEPKTMMTPDQIGRYEEIKGQKAAEASADAPVAPPADPNRTAGLKTQDPEYKKKLMAEIQARENAKKPVTSNVK